MAMVIARTARIRTSASRAWADVPATCGELVQGTAAGVPSMVTCPIDLFVRAWAEAGSGDRPGVTVRRAGCAGQEHPGPDGDDFGKARRAASAVMRQAGYRGSVLVELSSPVPRGKGMASSTADIAAACAAVAAALGVPLTAADLARLALAVEPSDGVMHEGIVVFGHRGAGLLESLGSPPPIEVLVHDYGGGVDTLTFNARPELGRLYAANEPLVARALGLVREGIWRRDPSLVGAGASLSALANQKVAEKARLERLIAMSGSGGLHGVCVGHSGTVLGLLVEPGWVMAPAIREWVTSLDLVFVGRFSLVGGGVRVGSGPREAGAAVSDHGVQWHR